MLLAEDRLDPSVHMTNKHKAHRPKLLSHTRPTLIKKAASLPSRATRSLIRNHHRLQKNLSSAISRDDTATVTALQAELSASGGLHKYQEASIQGQSLERGGDSSKVLMQWVNEILPISKEFKKGRAPKLKMLDVGALRIDTACSRSGRFQVTRIDLHSQHAGIETQDFMKRLIPKAEVLGQEGFDIVSLSLVVNYEGNAVRRGDMLKRVSSFLRPTSPGSDNEKAAATPSLFLVLPAPCVTNSRYLDEERLEAIMLSLGYEMLKRKISAKLVYYLWKYDKSLKTDGKQFKKEEIRRGGSRNNFVIVMA